MDILAYIEEIKKKGTNLLRSISDLTDLDYSDKRVTDKLAELQEYISTFQSCNDEEFLEMTNVYNTPEYIEQLNQFKPDFHLWLIDAIKYYVKNK